MDFQFILDILEKTPYVIIDILLKILPGWVMLMSIIAKLTPSEVDNRFVDKMLQLIHMMALNPTTDKARDDVGFKQLLTKHKNGD